MLKSSITIDTYGYISGLILVNIYVLLPQSGV